MASDLYETLELPKNAAPEQSVFDFNFSAYH